MTRFMLDRFGENPVPAGHVLVEDEVALLKAFLGSSEPMFIRAPVLCRWAEEVCASRGWPCEHLSAPAEELVDVSPGLSAVAATELIAAVGPALARLKRPLRAVDVAACLMPTFALWAAAPGPVHAAKWLQWLCQSDLSVEERILATGICEAWRASVPSLAPAYVSESREAAWGRLKDYLRVQPSDGLSTPFPEGHLEERLRARLRAEWAEQAIDSQGRFFDRLLSLGAGADILKVAATVVGDYFRHNPCHLDTEKVESLAPFLTEGEYWSLRQHVPPEDPGDPPEETAAVINWFRDRYLEFRTWTERFGQERDRQRVREVARRFGEWYLHSFVQARSGGAAADLLSWGRAAKLVRDRPAAITLFVVLDGLCYSDAKRLLSLLGQRSQRLQLDYIEAVFSPLPTTTRFAKPALFTGADPVQATFEEQELGAVRSDDADVIKALDALGDGEVVIWSLLEPDRTYHWTGDVSRTLDEVDLRLQSLAGRLANVCQAVDPTRKLRMVISSDHGRLLAVSPRTHPVPTGMTAHGRAAWGNVEMVFGRDGVVVEGDVAYLHPERFAIPETAAVLLDGGAFVTSDGRGGDEAYPHGGVYPEEVLVPWIEMTRDRDTVRLSAVASGRAPAGARGAIRLSVRNPSQLTIRLRGMSLSFLATALPLDTTVGPMDEVEVDIELEHWPTSSQVIAVVAVIDWLLPGGERGFTRFAPVLETDEMYVRDDILRDLGDL
jgi:hypothetical protein